MSQTLLGILIGITTSFLAGIVLIWKGDLIVQNLKRLPTKRRVALYSRAYLTALKSYPYRYAHLFGLTIVAMLIVTTLLVYILITSLAFTIDISATPEEYAKLIHDIGPSPAALLSVIGNAWILSLLTVMFAIAAWRIVFITIPTEILVPYAHRELTRLRECVSKCGTKKQFLEYTDAEHSTETLEDLEALVSRAKIILGGVNLELADEILLGISENFSKLNTNSLTINKSIEPNKTNSADAKSLAAD